MGKRKKEARRAQRASAAAAAAAARISTDAVHGTIKGRGGSKQNEEDDKDTALHSRTANIPQNKSPAGSLAIFSNHPETLAATTPTPIPRKAPTVTALAIHTSPSPNPSRKSPKRKKLTVSSRSSGYNDAATDQETLAQIRLAQSHGVGFLFPSYFLAMRELLFEGTSTSQWGWYILPTLRGVLTLPHHDHNRGHNQDHHDQHNNHLSLSSLTLSSSSPPHGNDSKNNLQQQPAAVAAATSFDDLYGLSSVREAEKYLLEDVVLGPRLVRTARMMLASRTEEALVLMKGHGEIDDNEDYEEEERGGGPRKCKKKKTKKNPLLKARAAMGAARLHSCMTLFEMVVMMGVGNGTKQAKGKEKKRGGSLRTEKTGEEEENECDVFGKVLEKYFGGKRHEVTLERVMRERPGAKSLVRPRSSADD